MRYPNTLLTMRGARGLAQWEVAQAVRIEPNRYGRMERGRVQPSLEEGLRLGQFFGVPAPDIFPVRSLETSAA
jgi:DNA-binding XRE family transcriptional regulator